MTKKYLAILATGTMLATAAIAQTPSTSPSPSPSATPAPSAAPATTGSVSPSGKPTVVNSQKSDQFLASSFKGTDVMGPDDKKIGDVNDLLFDKSGNIQAVIVGVGGFLGIGSKDVALTMASFNVMPGANGESPKLKLSMTKDELTQAAAFEKQKPPQPTAAQRPSPGGSPTSRAPAPSQ
jgi:sporulation protein YlmC with PRC-barrel domain